MPTIDKTYTITTSSGPIDVMENSQYQYLPFPARIAIGIAFDASTAGNDGGSVDVFCGSDLLQQAADIPDKGNIIVQDPYDFLVRDLGDQGERVGVVITPGGNAGTLRAVVMITRVA